jgi:peptidoglycan LD-endopeptidase LytH
MMMGRVRQVTIAASLAFAAIGCGGARKPDTRPRPAPAAEPEGLPDRNTRVPLDAPELMVPVEGVEPGQIGESFDAARGEAGERVHRAVDILAPRGTAALAAIDGRVYKVRSNALGGLTIYLVDFSGRWVYYYAHLDRYRPDLAEGMKVAQGDILGYVGTTGNAPPNTPHLHFQVMRWRGDGRYWDGEPIDPKPYFTRLGQRR